MALTKVSRGLLSTGIVDNSNATAITLNADESATFANRVGIGVSSPAYTLTVQKDVNDFIAKLENDGNSTTSNGLWVDTRWNTATNTVFQVTTNSGAQPVIVAKGDGKIGLGTSSPQKNLEIKDATLPVLRLNCGRNETSGSNYALGDIEFFSSDSSGNGARVLASINAIADAASTAPGGHLTFKTAQHNSAALECARFTNAGEFLVGQTSPSGSATGMYFRPGQESGINSDGDSALQLNRLTSDGAILRFYQGGTNVGSIGNNGTALFIASPHGNDSGLKFGDRAITPCTTAGGTRDDAINLGSSGSRLDTIFAKAGSINTSDLNEKQDIELLSDAEMRVAKAAKGLLRKYRWKSAVAEKGDDARIHFGIIAQDLQDAFTAEGLDAARYGMWCSDTWTNDDGSEQTRLGVRYSELLAFIISAI